MVNTQCVYMYTHIYVHTHIFIQCSGNTLWWEELRLVCWSEYCHDCRPMLWEVFSSSFHFEVTPRQCCKDWNCVDLCTCQLQQRRYVGCEVMEQQMEGRLLLRRQSQRSGQTCPSFACRHFQTCRSWTLWRHPSRVPRGLQGAHTVRTFCWLICLFEEWWVTFP